MPTNKTRLARASQNGVDMGMGLFATDGISKGANILTIDEPFVAVLEEKQLKDICSACFDGPEPSKIDYPPGTVKACTRCRVVSYCDKVGQMVFSLSSVTASILIHR